MRLAEIVNGVVINVIEVDPAAVPDWAADWPDAADAGPGWHLIDGALVPPQAPGQPVPQSVSMFQARTALRRAGLLAAVEAAVAASADPEIQDAWEYGTELHRASRTVAALAAQIGLTDAQVDDLFRVAATITA